ncbi:MAG: glycosyltransferase family 4 protein [PVC group bacterium]
MITSVVPYPPNDGGKIRIYQMLKNLADRYDIHFLSFYRDPAERERLEGIRPFCRSADAVLYGHQPMGLFSRALFPQYCQYWINPAMVKKITGILQSRPIGLAQIDFTLMAYYGRVIGDIPSIFVEHDAGILEFGKSYNPAGRGWKKLLEFYEWMRMLHFELDLLPAFTKVIVLNREDEDLLKSFLPLLDISTVTMGTDLEQFLEPYRRVGNKKMIYVGSMDHYPNVDAVSWFVSSMLPLIRETEPEAALMIVGSGTSDRIADIRGRPGVEYIGPVEDVRPYLREVAVFVAPVRLGSGMKGKVLEALAMAKPMVATPVAASGIPVVSGEHLLIADDARSFSKGVIRLFRDPALRETVARNGQRLVRENFGWKAKADEMDLIYREILDRS